ncbi:MAG: hypothetical protein QHH09_02745 [Microgenomates group bacterium]|nr:hypothetical protein [Microgenomates group bacterium]
MQTVCENCHGNQGKDFPFTVIIGDPLRCPRCGRIVTVSPVRISGEREAGGGRSPIQEVDSAKQ